MRGHREALRQHAEERLALAWDVEFFARQKRLQPLKHYIAKPPKAVRYQSGREILDVVRQLQEKGADIKIRRVRRKPRPVAEAAPGGRSKGRG